MEPMTQSEIESMTRADVEARIAALREHRELVATNEGTHGGPANWRRYSYVSAAKLGPYGSGPLSTDYTEGGGRGEGYERTFPRAMERVRSLRSELRTLEQRLAAMPAESTDRPGWRGYRYVGEGQ